MSVRWMARIFDAPAPIGPDRLMLLAIADAANDDGVCWPSYNRLARKAGVSRRTAIRTVQRLVEEGHLTIIDSSRSTNTYKLISTSDAHVTSKGGDAHVTSDAHDTSASDAHVTPLVTPTSPEPSLNRKLNRNTIVQVKKTPTAYKLSSADVERIYQAYPRHVGKQAALPRIRAALKAVAERDDVEDPVAWMIERVGAYAKSPAGKAGTYTPHPSTWFNQGRYDDDATEWQRRDDDERRAPARPVTTDLTVDEWRQRNGRA